MTNEALLTITISDTVQGPTYSYDLEGPSDATKPANLRVHVVNESDFLGVANSPVRYGITISRGRERVESIQSFSSQSGVLSEPGIIVEHPADSKIQCAWVSIEEIKGSGPGGSAVGVVRMLKCLNLPGFIPWPDLPLADEVPIPV